MPVEKKLDLGLQTKHSSEKQEAQSFRFGLGSSLTAVSSFLQKEAD